MAASETSNVILTRNEYLNIVAYFINLKTILKFYANGKTDNGEKAKEAMASIPLNSTIIKEDQEYEAQEANPAQAQRS